LNRSVYTVEFTNKIATAAMADFDFFEISPAAEKPVEIVAIYIGQESAEGDANEDFVRWAILRWTGGTLTSGGELATTPRALDSSAAAASGAYEAFNAVGTVATHTGTLNRLFSDTFNVRSGLQIVFPPEMRPTVRGDEDAVVRCESTLDASTTLSGTLFIREL